MISETIRRKMLTNAAQVDAADPQMEAHFVDHLFSMADELPKGYKVAILAFDFTYSAKGERLPAQTMFAVSNAFASRTALERADRFEWVASVHPFRADALEALRWAKANGARAVKWLPPAMGIDLQHERCLPAYDEMAKLNLPLLTHVGEERAVKGAHKPEFGHPLALRAPLDRGCRVIAAHCGTLGSSPDWEAAPAKKGGRQKQPMVRNFDLFLRLMRDPKYVNLLTGDISAVTQANRGDVVRELIEKPELHSRLLFGSDYPLPGVVPLTSLKQLASRQLLDAQHIPQLETLRHGNPLAFDVVLKRLLRADGKRFADKAFYSRSHLFAA